MRVRNCARTRSVAVSFVGTALALIQGVTHIRLTRAMAGSVSDEEAECRICRGGEELPARPLFHPCKCSGSIKYTHEECLVNWLAQSGSTRCELCHHPFRFEPLYEPNTPSALPTDELLIGLLVRASAAIMTAARVALVLCVWLFLLPLGTCWTWYALFINSLSQLPRLIASRGLYGIITDAFYGCLLSAGIIFVFLGVSSLREYILQMPDEAADQHAHEEDLRLVGNELMVDEAEAPHGFLQRDLAGPNVELGPVTPDTLFHAHAHPTAAPPQAPGEEGETQTEGRGPASGTSPGGDIHQGPSGSSNSFGEAVRANSTDANRSSAVSEDANRSGQPLATYTRQPESTASVRDQVFDGRAGDAASGDLRSDEVHAWNMDDGVADVGDEVFAEVDAFARDVFGDGDEDPRQPDPAMNIGLNGLDEDLVEDGGESDAESEGSSLIVEAGAPYADNLFHNVMEADEGDPIDNENAENAAAQLDGEGDGGALFGLFELDPDEVPLEEMVGLRGHLRNLFDNAGTVLVSNAMFLGIFTLIPLLVGSLALRVASLRSFPFLDSARQSNTSSSGSRGHAQVDRRAVAGDGRKESAQMLAWDDAAELSDVSLASMATSLSAGDVGTDSLIDGAAALSGSVAAETPIVSYVDNLFVVLLGYGVISLAAFGYVIVNSLIRSRYPRLDTAMTRQVVRVLRYLATFFKVVVLILFEFGIFPLGCGWWVDVCTLDIVGSTLDSRVAFCRDFPWTCTALHWGLGIFYMVHVSLFVSLLREVLRPELLWFLRNPDDPDFHPFRELVEKPLSRHARRMCLSVFIYVPLVVSVVYIPSQLCLFALPSVFPFDFSHSFVGVPFGNILIVPLVSLLHHARPGMLLRVCVRTWITTASDALGIKHLVARDDVEEMALAAELPDDEDNNAEDGAGFQGLFDRDENVHVDLREQDHEPVNFDNRPQNQPADSIDSLPSASDPLIQGHDPESPAPVSYVRVRGTTMLLLGWMTFVVGVSLTATIPTLLGRSLIKLISVDISHDLYSFGLGVYVLLVTGELLSRAFAVLSDLDVATAIQLVLPYVSVVFKGSILASLWFGFLPLAAGLLVELTVIVPLRVPYDQTPYFNLRQDWAFGLLLIRIMSRVVLAGGLDADSRERLERAREGGFLGAGRNFHRTMRELVGPVVGWSLTALSAPYCMARVVLPALGTNPALTAAFYRYIYLWMLWAYMLGHVGHYTSAALKALHDSIRDDRYLVGRRLYNYS